MDRRSKTYRWTRASQLWFESCGFCRPWSRLHNAPAPRAWLVESATTLYITVPVILFSKLLFSPLFFMCAALGFPVNTVAMCTGYFHADPHPGNLLATRAGDLVYLDFGMMSEAPLSARFSPTLVLCSFFTFFFTSTEDIFFCVVHEGEVLRLMTEMLPENYMQIFKHCHKELVNLTDMESWLMLCTWWIESMVQWPVTTTRWVSFNRYHVHCQKSFNLELSGICDFQALFQSMQKLRTSRIFLIENLVLPSHSKPVLSVRWAFCQRSFLV